MAVCAHNIVAFLAQRILGTLPRKRRELSAVVSDVVSAVVFSETFIGFYCQNARFEGCSIVAAMQEKCELVPTSASVVFRVS